MMKVISLVPSWTETLLWAGVKVVGRSRFCIHPADVENIPKVGGTKDVQWQKVKELNADLLILDREENTREMADQAPLPYFASHITGVADMPDCLQEMAEKIANPALEQLAQRWQRVVDAPIPSRKLSEIPGIFDWIVPLSPICERFVYLIWRDPWMAVSPGTFIGSMFAKLGFSPYHWGTQDKYPQIELRELDQQKTLLLCSTEPFPFHRKREQLRDLGFAAALIDGEQYSWFGLRSLQFLEEHLQL